MIVLFTDFGLQGPYTGQMKAVLHEMAPGVAVIDLFADAPVGNPKASAYLLAAYTEWFARRTVFLCVVDPGVGSAHPPIIVEADGRWYVGPGNCLFELVQRRATSTAGWDISWKPERLSASFHGRDLFAPVAAMLARGEPPPGPPHKNGAHRNAGHGITVMINVNDFEEIVWPVCPIAVNQGRADRELGLAIGNLAEIILE